MVRVAPWTLALGAIAAVAVACGNSTSPSGSTQNIGGFLSGASANGGTTVTVPQSGQPPSPTGGPSGSVSGGGTGIPGGSGTGTVTGSGSAGSVDVSVGTSSSSASGFAGLQGARPAATTTASGFFQVPLPSPATSVGFVVTFAKSIPATSFTLQFQLIAPTGAVGPVASLPITVQSPASGNLQVSVSWDQPSSINLQVVEPSGNVISALNPGPSKSGGILNLSSNTNCKIDNIDAENVGWPSTIPASGTYIVRLDYVATCGTNAFTDYVVTVDNNGAFSTPITGTFTPDEIDTKGVGRTVDTFTFGTATPGLRRFGLLVPGLGSGGPPAHRHLR